MRVEWPIKSYLEWRDGDTLCISVPFTWNLPEVRTRLTQLTFDQPSRVRVGGTGVNLMPEYLADLPGVEIGGDYPGVLQRFHPLATKTTRGCIRACRFCSVPKTEGAFRELEDWPDLPIICDNNLLRSSPAHFDRVCDRLGKFESCDIQGVDYRLLTDHHAERLSRIRAMCRVALDDGSGVSRDLWETAFQKLRIAKVSKRNIMCYALIGYDTGPEEAWNRCLWIEGHGIHAAPMWFHELDALDVRAITPKQLALGWTERRRTKIMARFYQGVGRQEGQEGREGC